MKLKSKFILGLSGLLCAAIMSSGNAYAANTTVSALKNKFPEGKYWNHYAGNGHTYFPDGYVDKGNCNNPDGVTNIPCVRHDGIAASIGQTDCNSFDGAQECMGFARKLFYDYYGTEASRINTHKNINSIKAGDILTYSGDSADSSGHTVWVTGVSGNTLSIAECNWGLNSSDRCKISWSRKIEKNAINVISITPAPSAINDVVYEGRVAVDTVTPGKIYVKNVDSMTIQGWATSNVDENVQIYVDGNLAVAAHLVTRYDRADIKQSKAGYRASLDLSKYSTGYHTLKVYVYKSDTFEKLTEKDIRFYIVEDAKIPDTFTAKIVSKANPNYAISMKSEPLNVNQNNVELGNKSEGINKYQTWFFEKYNGGNTYKITNLQSGNALTVVNSSTADGTNVITAPFNGSSGQLFYLTKYNNGIRIVPACATGLQALDLVNNVLNPGTNIQIYQNKDSLTVAAQTWTFESDLGVLGDINLDGYVNATDAAIVLDFYKNGGAEEIDFIFGDMDGNHILNATDAAMILDKFKNS